MGPKITVTVTGRIRPDRRKHLLAILPRFAAAARRHPGCLAFDYTLDTAERHRVTLVESWADPVAAMDHLATSRARRFLTLTHECLDAPPAMTTTTTPE